MAFSVSPSLGLKTSPSMSEKLKDLSTHVRGKSSVYSLFGFMRLRKARLLVFAMLIALSISLFIFQRDRPDEKPVEHIKSASDIRHEKLEAMRDVLKTLEVDERWSRYPLLWSRRVKSMLAELGPLDNELVELARTTKRVVIVAFTTEFNRRFCQLALSALANDNKLVVVGYGDHFNGWAVKVRAQLKYMDMFDPSDILIMVDGMDMTVQGSPDVIRRKFESLRLPLAFMAEKDCWPRDHPRCPKIKESTMPRWSYGPNTVTDVLADDYMLPRFFSAGLGAGYQKYLLPYFKELVRRAEEAHLTNAFFDDQWEAHQLFIEGNHNVSIDYDQELMFGVNWSLNDVEFVDRFDDGMYGAGDFDRFGPSKKPPNALVHKITGTIPSFIHYMGASKKDMDGIMNASWWGNLDNHKNLNDFQFTIAPIETKKWVDVCGSYFS